MKKYFLIVLFFYFSISSYSQIEKVIVETYYISDSIDATDTTGGGLLKNSKTYRVFIDLKKGSKIKKIYGDINHPLKFSSTSIFFNNKADGQSFAKDISKSRYGENTVALDTWLTIGQTTKTSAQTNFGVLKVDDINGSFVGGVNNDGGSATISSGLITNMNPQAGIAVTTADGMTTMAPAPSSWADYGFKDIVSGDDSTIFGSIVPKSKFISYNAGLQNSGTSGVNADSNYVLVAQFTTLGDLKFEINLEVEETNGTNTNIVKYVANDSVLLAGEILNPNLKYPPVCGCKDPDYLEYSNTYSCVENDSCKTLIVFGCTDTMACNYSASANFNIQTLCCYIGSCADRDISLVCPSLKSTIVEFEVFPNPAETSISLRYKNINYSDNESIYCSIYNVFGQLVYEKSIAGTSSVSDEIVNISEFKSGIYLVKISDGVTFSNKYFIKK